MDLVWQPCNGIHKVQGESQESHSDKVHLTNVGSTAGVIVGLLPGTEKDGKVL
jgi:hypothetical protein